MSIDAQTLLHLLPTIYRIRDAEQAQALGSQLGAAEVAELVGLEAIAAPNAAQRARIEALRARAGTLLTPVEQAQLFDLEAIASPTLGQQARLAELRGRAARGPLESLLTACAGELAVVEENLAQLYDDLFIETCADWTIPYIGDLIGYEPLHGLGQERGLARAEVAHTIPLRRRKGTVAALEQLARDVTGWNARAVEFFQRLGATQYLNHPRPQVHYAPDLRRAAPLARLGGAFDTLAHTLDVRRIENGRGRFNIPNIGLFLWRLTAYRHTRSPAVRVDDRRWLVSPLGHPLQLYTAPRAEDAITHLADPINVPDPIGRRVLADDLALYYGNRAAPTAPLDPPDPSIQLFLGTAEVPRAAIAVCDLRDDGAGWAHPAPSGHYAIDPVLGRIAVAADLPVPTDLRVSYRYGFAADLGGGEYDRSRRADPAGTRVRRVPNQHPTIQAALTALGGDGVVEITDSGRYAETLAVTVSAQREVTLRAAPGCRPTLDLGGPPAGPLVVSGGAGSTFTLDGLLVVGDQVRVPAADNALARLQLVHCTLVPGRSLGAAGDPITPGAVSLLVERPGLVVEIERAILGAVRINPLATLSAVDSIIDATDRTRLVYCAPDGVSPGGELALSACTLIGRIDARSFGLVANSLFLAAALPADPRPPVQAAHRQSGCVRFSFLPLDSLVPRRHRCQPADAASEVRVAPRFVSMRYGQAAYCQLGRATPDEIRRGGDDEGELGAFHHLFPAQREDNLETRLREFLRVGLAAGIFYAT